MANRTAPPEVRRWIEQYAVRMLEDDQVIELAEELNRELVSDVPALDTDPVVRYGLRASTETLLRVLLSELSKDPDADVAFPPAAVDFARTLAQRGYDVGLLLRLYRIGQRVFWRKLMEIVSEQVDDPDLRMDVLGFLWDQMSRVLERNIDGLVTAHSEESERRLRGALARRSETVHAILRGDPAEVDAATQQLGHNLHRTQTALVLWADRAAGMVDAGEKLEALASEAAAAVGAARPLAIRVTAEEVWAWLATGSEPPLARIADAPTLRQYESLRVAVGVPAAGVAGFRDSHREAVRAQAVAVAADRGKQVTHYRDVEVVSCLSADDAAMRALVARELGDLGGPGSGPRRLRETALAYLRVGGSARAAAAALGVHKNTILYRLRQVDELLGHPIDQRRLPLELALLIADTYGDRVLPDGRSGAAVRDR